MHLVLFLSLCFGLPLVGLAMQSMVAGVRDGIGALLLSGFSAMTPTIAAVLTMLLCSGKGSVKSLLHRCYRTPFKMRLCLVALLIPMLEIGIMQLMLAVTGQKTMPLEGISPTQVLVVAFALIAEELGWRGFLQDELESRMPSFLVPLCTGVIWALWHYHFYLSGSMQYPIFWFIIGCIADSYIYFRLTQAAHGNILPASLLHFCYNLMMALFFPNDAGFAHSYPFFILGSVVLAACLEAAAYKLRIDGGRTT